MRRRLRRTDPLSSVEAEEHLDTTPVQRNLDALAQWFPSMPDNAGTEREMGSHLHARGFYPDWETGRRRVRDLHEDGLLVKAYDHRGKRVRHENFDDNGNKTGWGYCYTLPRPLAQIIIFPRKRHRHKTGRVYGQG